ncbi:hypothetical protein IAT38_005800 [Cryptococcus sp. DSM 104549]
MAASLLPLDLRIRTLEAQLFGVPPSLTADAPAPAKGHGKAATRRLREISEGLERLGASSDGVKRLLDGYNQYLPLLTIPAAGPSTTGDDESQIKEEDLLPDSVKLTMVLEAAEDVKGAEKGLREIELLKEKGAEGSGELEELLALRPNLITALEGSQKQTTELDQVRQDVGQLLLSYSELTSTASELFIDLHHQMEALEEGVARLERKKRKELASRF